MWRRLGCNEQSNYLTQMISCELRGKEPRSIFPRGQGHEPGHSRADFVPNRLELNDLADGRVKLSKTGKRIFPHLRETASRVLPESLAGVRALDIGTFDGFWAFEMERRGAEVVAIDIERVGQAQLPPSNRSRLEREALGELRRLLSGDQVRGEGAARV